MNRKYIIISVFLILSLFLFPTNFVKGATDISYTFDDNVLIDSTINEFDNTFNVKNSSYYSGHYNATYSFENDIDGTIPLGWSNIDETGGNLNVISDFDNHSKVILMNHSVAGNIDMTNFFDDNIVSGIVEWWWYFSDSAKTVLFYLQNDTDTMISILTISGKFKYYDGEDLTDTGISVISNKWYHSKIIFNCTSDLFDFYLDNIQILSGIDFRTVADNLEGLFIRTGSTGNYQIYFDAIGYSWSGINATYTFTEQNIGDLPNIVSGSILFDGDCIVSPNFDSFTKVFNLTDDITPAEDPLISHYFTPSTSGTIEYYLGTNEVNQYWHMPIADQGVGRIIVYLKIDGGNLEYQDEFDVWQLIQAVSNDIFYHIRITWRADNTFDFYVDLVLKVDNQATHDNMGGNGIDAFTIQAQGDSINSMFLDNYGNIADPYYNLGDNLPSYIIGDNLIPYLNITGFKEVDKYEFALSGINTLIPVNTKEALGWEQTGVENELAIIIQDPNESDDRVYKLSTDGLAQTIGILNDDFTSTDNFITVDIEFEMMDMTGNNGTHTLIIESSDDNYIAMLDFRSNGSMNIFQAVDDFWGLQVRDDITTGKIYRVVVFINYELDITFIDFYIDGVYDDSYTVPNFYTGKNGLTKISLLVHSVDYADLHWNIDNIGVYYNGISQTPELAYAVYNIAQTWNTQINNLLFLKANGSFNIGLVEGSYTVGMSMTEFRSMRNYYNEVHTINGYDSDTTIANITFVFTLQNHYFNISTFKIDGVILKQGVIEYNLEFEHSGVDIDDSYFYVSNNRLYFLHIADDTNLEYIQATFNINDVNSSDYAFSFRSDMDNNAYGYIRINYTDISQILPIPYTLTTTRFLLSQDNTVRDIIVLITDKDNNVITGLTSGYIYNVELIDVIDIDVSVITESLLNMMIPLIIILVPTFLFSSRFGKQVIVPLFILFSLVLTISTLIPYWLFFIIVFPSIIMVFFKSKKEVV